MCSSLVSWIQEAKEEAFVFAVCGKRHFYIRAFEGGRKVTAGEQQQHVEGEEDSEERNLAPAWKTRHPNFAIVIETEVRLASFCGVVFCGRVQ